MSRFDEQVVEFGDGAVFESDAEHGDGKSNNVVLAAGDRDSGGACVEQDDQIVAKL